MVSATLTNEGRQLTLDNVVLDSGSVTTIFATERLALIGISPQPEDVPHEVRGIGGSEYVLDKTIQRLTVGDFSRDNFGIEIGAVDYGFDIDGILGLDFLMQVKAIIDLDRLELRAADGTL
jgi:hypothetical protein